MLCKELDQQLEMADSATIEIISVMLFELLQHHGTEQEIEHKLFGNKQGQPIKV